MEEDANIFTKPHLVRQHYNAQYQANPTNRGKPCSNFFLKFLFIALFLCLIPLFPSEPPDFISDTIFAKTWELIHLLIIGIALSYGLFCRPKNPQISPKTQISQPYAPNILHHSSIFDYEGGNPSGVSDKYAIPTKSFNLSNYREEPIKVSSRKDSRNFDDRPLGLPVRSLKSRVVDSDSEEQEEEENCASECESDMSGSSSSSSGEKDKILEGNLGNSSPMLCKSKSMRGDSFMAENGEFEGKQSKSESFRSPVTVTAASFCQNFSGLCSWLPESPNVDHRDNGWKENNFYMPFTNYNQVNDYNVMGMSPNLHDTSNFFMPPAASVHPSMPISATDFASNWGTANFGNGNVSVEKSGFFIPPTAVPASMPIPASDLASRSRRYNHETEIWGKSPNLQNETLGGGNPNHYMPSAAYSPSVPASADRSVSSVEASKHVKFNNGFSHKNKDGIKSKDKNVALSGNNEHWGNAIPSSMSIPASEFASRSKRYNHETENWNKSPNSQNEFMGGVNANLSMPSAAFSPRVPASADASASSIEASKNAKFNNGFSLKTRDELRSENNNVPSSGGNVNTFMPSAAFPPSMPTSTDDNASKVKASKNSKMPTSTEDYASSVKTSQNAKFNHGCSLNNNVALGGENTNKFMPPATCWPSKPDNDSASSVEASKNIKFNHGSSLKKKNELRSERNNMALGEDNKNFPIPSATFSPTMSASTDVFASSIKPSKSANGSALKKKKEMRSEGNKVAVESFKETTNSCSPHSNAPSGSKSLELEDGISGAEKPNYLINTTKVFPSVPPPVNEFASLIKDENRSEEHAGRIEEKTKSNTPHIVDPISIPTGIPLKKNEQRSIPEKWGDDCFVIAPSETNDVGDILLENLPPLTTSEASTPARSSSRMSSHEQESPRNKVNENVLQSAPRNNSEIVDVVEDVLGENDSYKPSTPSPPPRLQTRRNELVISSVESSSRALDNQSFLNDDDDLGSPPTPERRTLSRVSNSRRFGCGYFFDRDLRKSFKDEAKGNKKTKGDDDQFARGGKCGWDCLKLDVKPSLNRAALKGKSVRTIRPKETAQDQQNIGQIEQKQEEDIDGLSVANVGERKGEKPEMVFIKIGISEKRSNSNGRKGEKLKGDGGTTSIVLGLNSRENSSNTTVVPVNDVKEEGNDSEIDRKADEFIAKFKQQMRRQKAGPRGDPSRQHKKSLYRT